MLSNEYSIRYVKSNIFIKKYVSIVFLLTKRVALIYLFYVFYTDETDFYLKFNFIRRIIQKICSLFKLEKFTKPGKNFQNLLAILQV